MSLIDFDIAVDTVTAAVATLPNEGVHLNEALGRVLAADIIAKTTQPPGDVSAMDGYAVRHQDKPPLTIIGESAAGHPLNVSLKEGEAARIFTGAVLPQGADAILIQENAQVADGKLSFDEPVDAQRFVRPAGLDFKTGDRIEAGAKLTVRLLALAASMNHLFVQVPRRPIVAIVSTGDEVMTPGSALEAGQIVSSNHVALANLVRVVGGIPKVLGIARDNLADLSAKLTAAKGADLILTTGGASVGDHDLVHKVLTDLGADLSFYKIAMRPGKPLMFGRLWDAPVLGLPGNPVSSFVTASLFAIPLLQKLSGLPVTGLPKSTATLATPLKENDQRRDFLRANFVGTAPDGSPLVEAIARQDSSMLRALSTADCLIERAPFASPAKEGGTVVIRRFLDGPYAL